METKYFVRKEPRWRDVSLFEYSSMNRSVVTSLLCPSTIHPRPCTKMMRRPRDIPWANGGDINVARIFKPRPDLPLIVCPCLACTSACIQDPAVFDRRARRWSYVVAGSEYRVVGVPAFPTGLPRLVAQLIDPQHPWFIQALANRFRVHDPSFLAGDPQFVLEAQHLMFLGSWVNATVDELGTFFGRAPPRCHFDFWLLPAEHRSCWRLVRRLLAPVHHDRFYAIRALAALVVDARAVPFPRRRSFSRKTVVRKTAGQLLVRVCVCDRCQSEFRVAPDTWFDIVDAQAAANVDCALVGFPVSHEADHFVVRRARGNFRSWAFDIVHALHTDAFTNVVADDFYFGNPSPPCTATRWGALSQLHKDCWQAVVDLMQRVEQHQDMFDLLVARRIAQLLAMQ